MMEVVDPGERIAYWAKALADASIANIPSDRERSGLKGGPRGRVVVALDPELQKASREVAGQADVAVAEVFAAAFGIVVARYARLDDLVIGVGVGSELLPLRVTLSRTTTARELMVNCRDALRAARLHALALPAIASAVSGTDAPLALFTAGLVCGLAPPASLDVVVIVDDSGDSLTASLDYDTVLWDSASARRMADLLVTHARSLTSEPDRRVLPFPALDAAEQRRIVELASGRVIDHPFVTADELFVRRAAIDPRLPAMKHGGRVVSYGEVVERASRLAQWLTRRVAPNATIGIMLARSPEFVIAELATWMAGHAFVPIEPSTPSARTAQILTDSGAALVLCSDTTMAACEGAACEVVSVDALAAVLENERTVVPPRAARPSDLAYVIFTSGSTGTPKGVAIHHAGLSNLLHSDRDELLYTTEDRVTQIGSCAFDSAIEAIWAPLTGGATLFFVDETLFLSPAAFMRWLIEERITRCAMPSSVFEALVDADWTKTQVRRVGTGLEKLHKIDPAMPFVLAHGYGPTECTVGASRLAPVREVPPSVGRPLDNVRIYVLDEDLQLLPHGALGEGYIGGAGVGRGYLRADLTAERFLPDPFGPAGARMYRTGDVLRWRSDHELMFCGRTDAQVKIRGYRIEPGEIQAALDAHPEVRSSFVLVAGDDGAPTRLIAYVVPRGTAKPSASALQAALRARLPSFMIPRAFVFLDAIPLTPGGKVNRAALPAPEHEASAYAAPSTPLEQELARVFEVVLGVERVGVDDDFFVLGGDSILVMKALSAIQASMKEELHARDFFEGPTVRQLAVRLAAPVVSLVGPPRLERLEGSEVVASFEEEYVLSWEARRERSATWNHGYRVDLQGPLDAARLEEAVRATVARQEALRRVFDLKAQGHGARLCSSRDIAFERAEARGHADEAFSLIVDARVNVPFPFDGGPLVRFALLQRSTGDHSLVVSWHEAINDATTTPLVTSEILEHYQALGEQREPALPELDVQYADYARWSRDWFAEGGRGEVAAARARLLTAKPLDWADRPGTGQLSTRKVSAQFLLESAESDRFDVLCRAEATTPFAAASALVGALLRKVSGQDDFVFVTLTNFRDARLELVPLAGRFINPLPVRLSLQGGMTWRELFGRGRAAVVAALSAHDMPTPLSLVFDTESPLDHPLGQIALNFMGESGSPTPRSSGDLTTISRRATTMTGARNNLFFAFGTTQGRLFVHVGGAADRYDLATIQSLTSDLRRLITELDPLRVAGL